MVEGWRPGRMAAVWSEDTARNAVQSGTYPAAEPLLPVFASGDVLLVMPNDASRVELARARQHCAQPPLPRTLKAAATAGSDPERTRRVGSVRRAGRAIKQERRST